MQLGYPGYISSKLSGPVRDPLFSFEEWTPLHAQYSSDTLQMHLNMWACLWLENEEPL